MMYRVGDRVLFSLSSFFLLSVFLLGAYVKWGHGPVTPTTTTPRTEESRTMKCLLGKYEKLEVEGVLRLFRPLAAQAVRR